MTKLFEKALDAARQLAPVDQDEIALLMLNWMGNESEPEEIDPADMPGVLEGLAQAEKGEFASDEEVQAVFRRFSS